MARNMQPSMDMLVRKLETQLRLTSEERAALETLPAQGLTLRRGQDIVREGDRPHRCCVMLEGIACWFKVTGEGTRQILSFHIAGEIPDLQSLHLEAMDATLTSLSTCEVAFFNHDVLRRLCYEFPRIAGALWRFSLVDAAIFREWVVNLGGRQALSRVAHVFCEMFVRFQNIGLVEDDTCVLPLTQGELAEATGLSTVHINRVLQALRRQKLIRFGNNRLTVLDWQGLVKLADFDANYLHLDIMGFDSAPVGLSPLN